MALLYYKGFHSLQTHRMAHALWCKGKKLMALTLQSRHSEVRQGGGREECPNDCKLFGPDVRGLLFVVGRATTGGEASMPEICAFPAALGVCVRSLLHVAVWMQVFAVDIHPAARLGSGLFMDHACGVVIGETAVVGNNVTIMQVGRV